MTRKVAAILAADIVGFSRLIAEDEEETLQRLAAYRNVFDDIVAQFGGRVFNRAGDSMMCDFTGAAEAARAAIEIQEFLRARNLAYPPQRWLQLRIGISIGDVVERNGDLLGGAVNIAARLENLASPGGICVSGAVHEAILSEVPVPFVDLGQKQMKNIPLPVHAFAIAWPGTGAPIEAPPATPRPVERRSVLLTVGACAAALVVGGGIVIGQQLAALPPTRTVPMGWQQRPAAPDAPVPAQQAARALSLSANPVETFAQLVQKGGQIEDPHSAPGLYHNALLFEAKGESVGAHRAYYALARMGLEFIDPHLRYAALVRIHEGRATARQVYAELNEDAPTRATALVHALQFDLPERRARLNALIAEHPGFAPAYYFLAEEHSEDRIGTVRSIRDRQIEFAALTEFLKAEREGRLAPFFLDHTVAGDWLERARTRHAKLEMQFKSASAEPSVHLER